MEFLWLHVLVWKVSPPPNTFPCWTRWEEILQSRMPLSCPPTSLYRHIDDAEFEDKVRFLNETIYQIKKQFDGNMKAVTWDKKNLDDFLNILERQFENLNSCVSPAMKPERRLKRYFKKLNRKVLRKMNYSAQAWELIRKETQRHLQRLEILVGKMY
ncbi:hypothetical protein J4Q44_G00301390 [Coregonus suidteri]|uniref:Uncharacterized protein n=1 Tax=Coregonus suidteri TaxID=861788 RepID=A0AAN8LAU5_9TELE